VEKDCINNVPTTLKAGSDTGLQAVTAFNAAIATKDEATCLQA